MIESLKKSFDIYSKSPFLFVWASIMYISVFIATVLASAGIVVIYFITMAIFSQAVDPASLPTMALGCVVGLLLMLLLSGLNAALAAAYHSAFWKEKTALTTFYAYAMDKGPTSFVIMLMRELVWLVLAGPAIAIYIYYLSSTPYMDLLTGGYVLSVTFVIHMVFTPALLSAGAFGTDLYNSLKHAFDFLRRRHIFFVGQYALFAVTWFLNFVPFLQFVTIFFAYPVVYTAMINMMEESVKVEKEEE